MCNCATRWYTVVDEMSVDEMSVDELSWNPSTQTHVHYKWYSRHGLIYEIGRKRLRKTLLKDSLWWVKAEKRKMYFTERLFTMNLDSSSVIDHAGLDRLSESF